ncbi:thioesterase domain-containing protein [Endothiovibrio diazotrophicus]
MDDPNSGGNGGANDASERMKGLSEAQRKLLDAMLQQPWAGYYKPYQEQAREFGEPFGFGAGAGTGSGSAGPAGTPPPFEGGGAPPDTASLVAMKASGSRPPFFCVHAILGSAFPYHRLAMHMAEEQPFYALQSRGLDGVSKPLDTIEAMATHYIELIRGVQPSGPYYLGGYSFGGWVAFEMAQQLTAAGESVALLAMLGVGAPIAMINPILFEQFKYATQYADDYRELVLNAFWSDAARSAATEQAAPGMAPGAATPWLSPVATVTAVNQQAQFRYIPRPYAGAITLFNTAEQQAVTHPDATMGWKMLSVQEVAVHAVAGNHLSMLQEPHVEELADKLSAAMRESS